MSEPVVVTVWKKLGAGFGWGLAARLDSYESLSVEPRHNAPGVWSLVLPVSDLSAKLTKTRLVTFDYRGTRVTGAVRQYGAQADDSGRVSIEATGVDVLAWLGHLLCWPDPAAALGAQSTDRYRATGAAETVLRALVVANSDRLAGFELAAPASAGRGGTVNLSERFSNLLTVVQSKASYAGLGVRLGLVNRSGTSTRADLTLQWYVPADKSNRVRLSHKVGTMRTWKQADTSPTATRAIVGGSGQGTARVFRQVVDGPAEAEWGSKQEVFVDARDATTTTLLDERGAEALTQAAEQSSFELEAVEATGMRYGEHFSLGDKVLVELLTGVSSVQPLGGVKLAADASGTTVQLIPGNPDSANPLFAQAAIMRGTRQRLAALEREEG